VDQIVQMENEDKNIPVNYLREKFW